MRLDGNLGNLENKFVKPPQPQSVMRLNRKERRKLRMVATRIVARSNMRKAHHVEPHMSRFHAEKMAAMFAWLFEIPEIHALAKGE